MNNKSDVKPRNKQSRSKLGHAQKNKPPQALDDELQDLADAIIEGRASMQDALDAAADGASADERKAIAKTLARYIEDAREALGVGPELTEQEREILLRMREHEELKIAHMLSRETLRKIRGMFLREPGLLQAVLSMSNTLQEKGIAGMGMNAPAPTLPPAPDKDKSQEPSR